MEIGLINCELDSSTCKVLQLNENLMMYEEISNVTTLTDKNMNYTKPLMNTGDIQIIEFPTRSDHCNLEEVLVPCTDEHCDETTRVDIPAHESSTALLVPKNSLEHEERIDNRPTSKDSAFSISTSEPYSQHYKEKTMDIGSGDQMTPVLLPESVLQDSEEMREDGSDDKMSQSYPEFINEITVKQQSDEQNAMEKDSESVPEINQDTQESMYVTGKLLTQLSQQFLEAIKVNEPRDDCCVAIVALDSQSTIKPHALLVQDYTATDESNPEMTVLQSSSQKTPVVKDDVSVLVPSSDTRKNNSIHDHSLFVPEYCSENKDVKEIIPAYDLRMNSQMETEEIHSEIGPESEITQVRSILKTERNEQSKNKEVVSLQVTFADPLVSIQIIDDDDNDNDDDDDTELYPSDSEDEFTLSYTVNPLFSPPSKELAAIMTELPPCDPDQNVPYDDFVFQPQLDCNDESENHTFENNYTIQNRSTKDLIGAYLVTGDAFECNEDAQNFSTAVKTEKQLKRTHDHMQNRSSKDVTDDRLAPGDIYECTEDAQQNFSSAVKTEKQQKRTHDHVQNRSSKDVIDDHLVPGDTCVLSQLILSSDYDEAEYETQEKRPCVNRDTIKPVNEADKDMISNEEIKEKHFEPKIIRNISQPTLQIVPLYRPMAPTAFEYLAMNTAHGIYLDDDDVPDEHQVCSRTQQSEVQQMPSFERALLEEVQVDQQFGLTDEIPSCIHKDSSLYSDLSETLSIVKINSTLCSPDTPLSTNSTSVHSELSRILPSDVEYLCQQVFTAITPCNTTLQTIIGDRSFQPVLSKIQPATADIPSYKKRLEECCEEIGTFEKEDIEYNDSQLSEFDMQELVQMQNKWPGNTVAQEEEIVVQKGLTDVQTITQEPSENGFGSSESSEINETNGNTAAGCGGNDGMCLLMTCAYSKENLSEYTNTEFGQSASTEINQTSVSTADNYACSVEQCLPTCTKETSLQCTKVSALAMFSLKDSTEVDQTSVSTADDYACSIEQCLPTCSKETLCKQNTVNVFNRKHHCEPSMCSKEERITSEEVITTEENSNEEKCEEMKKIHKIVSNTDSTNCPVADNNVPVLTRIRSRWDMSEENAPNKPCLNPDIQVSEFLQRRSINPKDLDGPMILHLALQLVQESEQGREQVKTIEEDNHKQPNPLFTPHKPVFSHHHSQQAANLNTDQGSFSPSTSNGLSSCPNYSLQCSRPYRVGLSRRQRVSPLHPYWSSSKIRYNVTYPPLRSSTLNSDENAEE